MTLWLLKNKCHSKPSIFWRVYMDLLWLNCKTISYVTNVWPVVFLFYILHRVQLTCEVLHEEAISVYYGSIMMEHSEILDIFLPQSNCVILLSPNPFLIICTCPRWKHNLLQVYKPDIREVWAFQQTFSCSYSSHFYSFVWLISHCILNGFLVPLLLL